MKQATIFSSLDLSILVNSKVGTLRDEALRDIDSAETWLNGIIKSREEACIKKKSCEVCNLQLPYRELHHVAGRKHDIRTIIACKQCHDELTEIQKTWDARWYKPNQPENLRLAFFLLGLHDILLLKSKKTANSIYEELAKKFRQDIATLLTRRDQRALQHD